MMVTTVLEKDNGDGTSVSFYGGHEAPNGILPCDPKKRRYHMSARVCLTLGKYQSTLSRTVFKTRTESIQERYKSV